MIFSGIGIIDSFFSAPPAPVEQCFTSNGTWSCCPGAVCVEVIAIGGGGGGGGGVLSAGGSNAPSCAAAGQGGGGAGGVSICVLTSGFSSSQCVVIGNGGAGGAQGTPASTTAGGDGGATCFGTLVCAGGGFGPPSYNGNSATRTRGAGGVGNQGTSPSGGFSGCFSNGGLPPTVGGSAVGFPGGGGGASGLPAGGFDSRPGCAGGAGSTICGITLGAGGNAGLTRYGPSSGGTIGDNKTNGQCYGAGGGGGGGGCNTTGSPNYNGANGFQGILKVTQYFA
jgi:hypothetical protein